MYTLMLMMGDQKNLSKLALNFCQFFFQSESIILVTSLIKKVLECNISLRRIETIYR